ncbi:MAG: dipeptide/oligopeptide/nickel ABC transporter ATP-binding protein [Desulfobacteraceae bacterium 4572_87]|nr:MAG: dipeptide/oligopeptide/nickel ABC transporter ATP-binding protein [Desulfobacteraceae bacterium 4572_87]
MNTNGKPVLEIKDVSKIYKAKAGFFAGSGKDVVALDRISLEIDKGEIFGLVGESGSGKTTAGRLIVSLEETDHGEILLDGKTVTGLKGKRLKKFRSKAQMIFQDPYQSLNPQRSILDTVSEPLIIHRLGHANSRKERVREALRSVGLSPPDDFLYRYPHRLSGGQRQRVAIARAMILDPAVLYHGRLMELGPSDQVIQNPSHPYTQALIDALPKFGHSGNRKRYGTLLTREREGADERLGCNFFPRCAVAQESRCNLEKPILEDMGNRHHVACFLSQS